MAQDISLMGATFSDVPAVTLPKSGGGTAVFVDPVELIDDTAGSGDTDKVWSADKLVTEFATKQDAPPASVSVAFSADNTWLNSSGVAETDSNYYATDYIDLDDAVAIAYTGKMGSSRACFWYNSSKTFIDKNLYLNDRTAQFENVLTLRPDGAKYLRLQSRKHTVSSPPTRTPEVTVYYDENYIDTLKQGIVGDGVTDDTTAVQKIVNMCESVVFPHRDQILISGTIDIRMGYARIIDGNGCGIIVDDDFYALTITGSLTGTTEPTGMDAYVVKNEASLIVKNFRITAEDTTEGGGIEVSKSFKLKLCDNYIHHMKNGIRVYHQNRELMVSNNNVFACTECCLLFDQGVNLHQCNIENNFLQYAHDVIYIKQPQAVANFQITGNDIEIIDWPSSTYSTATCLNLLSSSSTNQFSECEITGNSIQGHEGGPYLIVIAGASGYEITNIAISGNHISNSTDSAISMAYVKNITISGNNYAVIHHFAYELAGTCENIVITGESGTGNNSYGGKLHAASTATLSNVLCKNVVFTPYDTVSIETSNVTNVDVYDEKNISVSGSTPSITAVPNARYICGEVSTLSFTPCAKGVCEVVFTSGSTATTLTVPNTVKWSDDFDPSDLDASTTYALNVLNGTMGVAAKWA